MGRATSGQAGHGEVPDRGAERGRGPSLLSGSQFPSPGDGRGSSGSLSSAVAFMDEGPCPQVDPQSTRAGPIQAGVLS